MGAAHFRSVGRLETSTASLYQEIAVKSADSS